MTISLRLNDRDSELIKRFAEMQGVSVSELVRRSVISKIEDEYDLRLYNEALAEYRKDPKTYSLDEVERELAAE